MVLTVNKQRAFCSKLLRAVTLLMAIVMATAISGTAWADLEMLPDELVAPAPAPSHQNAPRGDRGDRGDKVPSARTAKEHSAKGIKEPSAQDVKTPPTRGIEEPSYQNTKNSSQSSTKDSAAAPLHFQPAAPSTHQNLPPSSQTAQKKAHPPLSSELTSRTTPAAAAPPAPSSPPKVVWPNDKDVLKIWAKRVKGLRDQGHFSLIGEVRLEYQGFVMICTEAAIKMDPRSWSIDHVHATGPIVVTGKDPKTGRPINGQSKQLIYNRSSGEIVLRGQVKLTRGVEHINSSELSYNLSSGIINSSSASGILLPQQPPAK